MKKFFRHKNGFTLIELLVVIGIISILSGVALVVINPGKQFAKGRDSNRKKDLALISTALEQYYADKNAYPSSATIEDLGKLLTDSPKYINTMPADAQTGFAYCYSSPSPNYQTFVLCARMESEVSSGVTSCGPLKVAPAGMGDYCVTNPF